MGGLLLIKDCLESPGAFVMLQALKLSLSISYRVALVSVAQGAQHYQPVLRKLGINLHALTSSGQLVFLDALNSVAELTGGQSAPGISLMGLFRQVAELATSDSSSQPLCLVIDDLSGPGCLVALAHWDVSADEPWLSRVEHAAQGSFVVPSPLLLGTCLRQQTVVEVEPLASGQAADVTGNLTVCRRQLASVRPASAGGDAYPGQSEERPSLLLGGEGLGSQAFYYRLSENSAAYFPKAG
ncbi:hypothetical protein N2152v2_008082 [Parachlorella kessleri]